jgi:catechol 2,3-dioxygenase-like lactoylglutathione lyase family enzyme
VTTGVNHITFAVSDLDRALRFYVDVVGCSKVATWERGAYLRAGEMWLCLSLDQRASIAAARDYTHIAFTFDVEGLAKFRERLSACSGVEWKTNASEGDSVYFLDPDGHQLEAHVGGLESRLASMRELPYDGLVLHSEADASQVVSTNRARLHAGRITTGCSGR